MKLIKIFLFSLLTISIIKSSHKSGIINPFGQAIVVKSSLDEKLEAKLYFTELEKRKKTERERIQTLKKEKSEWQDKKRKKIKNFPEIIFNWNENKKRLETKYLAMNILDPIDSRDLCKTIMKKIHWSNTESILCLQNIIEVIAYFNFSAEALENIIEKFFIFEHSMFKKQLAPASEDNPSQEEIKIIIKKNRREIETTIKWYKPISCIKNWLIENIADYIKLFPGNIEHAIKNKIKSEYKTFINKDEFKKEKEDLAHLFNHYIDSLEWKALIDSFFTLNTISNIAILGNINEKNIEKIKFFVSKDKSADIEYLLFLIEKAKLFIHSLSDISKENVVFELFNMIFDPEKEVEIKIPEEEAVKNSKSFTVSQETHKLISDAALVSILGSLIYIRKKQLNKKNKNQDKKNKIIVPTPKL